MDEIVNILTKVVPPDWWRVLAFLFAGALLTILYKGVAAFIAFAKKWLDRQEGDHKIMREDIDQVRSDLKDLVAVNKMHEWRLTTAEADIVKLQDWKVRYKEK